MILGRVIGTVWATRKNPRLERLKLAIIRPCCWYNPSHDIDHLVAVDQVGAERGQDVLVCVGQPGRWMAGSPYAPIEASVMAIVDKVEVAGEALTDPVVPFRLREDNPPGTLVITDLPTQAEDRRS